MNSYKEEDVIRPEIEIFEDLERLCRSPGYAHAIAYFCFRDNVVRYQDGITPDSLSEIRSDKNLTRTEISTLVGLMIKGEVDTTLPTPTVMQGYIDSSEKLLNEIHEIMGSALFDSMKDAIKTGASKPFGNGAALREPIFYSGEGAYTFQYRDLCPIKYQFDEKWFQKNKGFIPENAAKFLSAIRDLGSKKLADLHKIYTIKNIDEFTCISSCTYSSEEIAKASKLSIEVVKNIINAFSVSSIPGNSEFRNIGGFNEINAYPIIPIGNDQFLIFQYYNITEAMYETPFFWMLEDKSYSNESAKNRGVFAERFCAQRLSDVLGERRIFKNVKILSKNNETLGEIDVLALYADKAIIVQAKSKRLTIQARQGNDHALQRDFKVGVQSAYDQGFSCGELILSNKYKLIDEDKNPISVKGHFNEIFIFCVLADYYPALAFQADHFLSLKKHTIIKSPYVMDVFFLDLMCEFLETPLQLFNYLHRRLGYSDAVRSSNEIAVLSYHLAYNLWVDRDDHFLMLHDDVSVHVDSAFLVRREGLPGDRTPKGILTKMKGTLYDKIIKEISFIEHDGIIDLGYFLLELNEETCNSISESSNYIRYETLADKKLHDFTIGAGDCGLTVHCNYLSDAEGYERLYSHCALRKYGQKAPKWFGISITPFGKSLIRYVCGLSYEWEKSDDMELALEKMPQKQYQNLRDAIKQTQKHKKIGRNDSCHCGSGKKFKKCCLDK